MRETALSTEYVLTPYHCDATAPYAMYNICIYKHTYVYTYVRAGLSMSTSRMAVMDEYDLRPDPCDNQLIRLSNCCKCLSFFLKFCMAHYILCTI